MREERHTQLEARQEQVETRLRQVLDYCRKVAADSANRQNVIDELRNRVAELENEQVGISYHVIYLLMKLCICPHSFLFVDEMQDSFCTEKAT